MYVGINSFETKRKVVATIQEGHQDLDLVSGNGLITINLEFKDLPWLKELVSEAQKIITFYEKEATQP